MKQLEIQRSFHSLSRAIEAVLFVKTDEHVARALVMAHFVFLQKVLELLCLNVLGNAKKWLQLSWLVKGLICLRCHCQFPRLDTGHALHPSILKSASSTFTDATKSLTGTTLSEMTEVWLIGVIRHL